ncbi:MAG: glycosyltransferase family 39 protein [Chloracidobacterium sp.]|nr:glycosyltransferase family 39 protein [Chloracidobacterium sp.]
MSKKKKGKKPSGQPRVVAAEQTSQAAVPPQKPKRQPAAFRSVDEWLTDQRWFVAAGVITLISIFLRFWQLSLKPFHHDEGVNGFFLRTLFLDGTYRYDPTNYHGPSLYYISLAFAKVFGLETIPVRASMAIFGVLMVALAFFLKRYLGRVGSLMAALFLAISPGMVFISRYFIHEIFFVFLGLALAVAVVYFVEKQRVGIYAIAWTALILLVCYAPSTVKLSTFLGGDSSAALWGFAILFFIVEAVLTYLVIKWLLSWDNGRPIYMILASASVAMFFATKETAFITLGTMLIACVSVWIWRRIMPDATLDRNRFNLTLAVTGLAVIFLFLSGMFGDAYKWLFDTFMPTGRPPETFVFVGIVGMIAAAVAAWLIFLFAQRSSNESDIVEPSALTWGSFRAALGDNRNLIMIATAVIITFVYLCVLFFTSFFTYAEGWKKAFEAYAVWTKTGSRDHTMHGWTGYIKWGMKIESAILILSLLGALVAWVKAKHRFAIFAGFWSFGLFAAYSIIPYKTPWLALSFLLPMCLSAGYGLNELIGSRDNRLRFLGAALGIVAVSVLGYQTYQLNFVKYDNDEMPYVYAHTRREFLDLINEIARYADKSGKGKDAQIEIVSPDYWPMTWYVKDYGKAYFQGRPVDASTAEMIVAKKGDQDSIVAQKYATHYKFAGVYPLRPGVDLMLLVRNDLAETSALDLSKIPEYKKP